MAGLQDIIRPCPGLTLDPTPGFMLVIMKIGELSRRTATPVDTIRYYERRGLIPEVPRSAGGYRCYGQEAVRRLRFIRQAKALGFRLDEIAQLLSLSARDAACEDVRRVAQAKAAEIETRIARLGRMHDCLMDLARACETHGDAACPILGALEEPAPDEPARSGHTPLNTEGE